MKRITLALITVLSITFMACEDDTATETSIDAEVEAADLDSEESFDYINEDVDEITEAGIADIASASGGRTEFNRRAILRCADVEHDTINKTITIEYDSLDDCQNPFGHSRHGRIIVTYNDRRYVPGAFRSVTFEDFYIDDVQVEGVRTITNISGTTEDAPKFQVTVEGGRLTFADGTTIERNVDHIRTWNREEDPDNDTVTLEGSSNGTRRDGTSYNVEILQALTFKKSCRPQAYIPASGVKEITSGENVMTIDFGDGTCDNLADVTLNGVTETIEINPRGFRR